MFKEHYNFISYFCYEYLYEIKVSALSVLSIAEWGTFRIGLQIFQNKISQLLKKLIHLPTKN